MEYRRRLKEAKERKTERQKKKVGEWIRDNGPVEAKLIAVGIFPLFFFSGLGLLAQKPR